MIAAPICNLNDDLQHELLDLCADITEMYETADTQLRTLHSNWSHGRALLQREWAISKTQLLQPLMTSIMVLMRVMYILLEPLP